MKRLAVIAAIVAVVAVTVLGVRVIRMHDAYGEWRLTATETPSRIAVLSRDYDRSFFAPKTAAPSGFAPRGKTKGGGIVLAPKGVKTPVVIYVRDDDGEVWEYALVGGP